MLPGDWLQAPSSDPKNHGSQPWARFGGSDLGSDHAYQPYTLDLRGYWPVGGNTVVAGQYLTTHLQGDAPFYLLPRLGGDEALRGYRGGLYMDKTQALCRFEVRQSQLWGVWEQWFLPSLAMGHPLLKN